MEHDFGSNNSPYFPYIQEFLHLDVRSKLQKIDSKIKVSQLSQFNQKTEGCFQANASLKYKGIESLQSTLSIHLVYPSLQLTHDKLVNLRKEVPTRLNLLSSKIPSKQEGCFQLWVAGGTAYANHWFDSLNCLTALTLDSKDNLLGYLGLNTPQTRYYDVLTKYYQGEVLKSSNARETVAIYDNQSDFLAPKKRSIIWNTFGDSYPDFIQKKIQPSNFFQVYYLCTFKNRYASLLTQVRKKEYSNL